MHRQIGLAAVAALLVAGCTLPNGGGGNVGRKTGAVNPTTPPSTQPTCSTLDEAACNARPDCVGLYGDAVCENLCAPGTVCPPCTGGGFISCDVKPPDQPGPCEGRTEAQCNADPMCHASYTDQCPPCPQGTVCGPCQPSYAGCSPNLPPQDPCQGLDEQMCLMKSPFCQPDYYAVAMVCIFPEDGGTNCVDPAPYRGCHVSVRSCFTNCDCDVNEYCAVSTWADDLPAGVDAGTPRCPTPQSGVCVRAPGQVYPVDPPIASWDGGWPTKDADAGSANWP